MSIVTFPVRTKMIGIIALGGGATNALCHGYETNQLQPMKSVVLDLEKSKSIPNASDFITLDHDAKNAVVEAFSNFETVHIIAGLGGKTGSTIEQVSSLLKRHGVNVIPLIILPFKFEGQARLTKAEQIKQRLMSQYSVVYCFDNESILATLGKGRSLLDGFKACNDEIITAINCPTLSGNRL
uniref:Cell division protein FtsZ n=1 Tax=Aliivibrio wodanis TaxID=80852 RepID=A0A5Q4ZMK2_9GAMM|nr:Cell division protein FtsZ [Aliivibrio wodanis]